jgi:hypothetical protein
MTGTNACRPHNVDNTALRLPTRKCLAPFFQRQNGQAMKRWREYKEQKQRAVRTSTVVPVAADAEAIPCLPRTCRAPEILSASHEAQQGRCSYMDATSAVVAAPFSGIAARRREWQGVVS